MEASVQREIACLEAAGATVSVSPGRGLRPTRFSAKFPAPGGLPSDASFAEVHGKAKGCGDAESAAVAAKWAAQIGDPSETALAVLYARLEQCLRDGGSPADRPALAAGLGAFGTYVGRLNPPLALGTSSPTASARSPWRLRPGFSHRRRGNTALPASPTRKEGTLTLLSRGVQRGPCLTLTTSPSTTSPSLPLEAGRAAPGSLANEYSPFAKSTVTFASSSNSPASTRFASSFSMRRWTVRRNGRAPNAGSYPSRTGRPSPPGSGRTRSPVRSAAPGPPRRGCR